MRAPGDTKGATIEATGAMTRLELCALVMDLIRELAAVRAELGIYREMVSVALTQLYEKNRERARERDSYYRLLDDYRALRGKARRVRR